MKLAAAQRAQSFRCEPLSCTVSRGACAERYERWSRDRPRNMPSGDGAAACACRGCPIGAAHAAGQVADVQLANIHLCGDPRKPAMRRCMGCAKPLQPRPREPGRASYPRHVCGLACWALFQEFQRQKRLPELA